MDRVMNNRKILSVSIAAYNVSATLDQALEPFLNEDVLPYVDVMIVDDGSKDHTAEIAKRYESQFPGTFRLITKENGGWGSTVNTGIAEAKGKYFKQLDGDDYFSNENLADFINFLQTTDADMIHTPFIQFQDGTGAVIDEVAGYAGEYSRFILNRTVRIDECGDYIPSMHCISVKTEILRRNNIQIMEHCFYTDLEYALKTYNCCETICFYEKPIYYYRLARSGQSMSVAGARKHYRDHIRMLKNILLFSQNEVFDPYKKKNIESRVCVACTWQYVFFFALECTKEEKAELREFDSFLKKGYPDVYNKIDGKVIHILQRTHFIGYRILATLKMQRDKRLKRYFYQGG